MIIVIGENERYIFFCRFFISHKVVYVHSFLCIRNNSAVLRTSIILLRKANSIILIRLNMYFYEPAPIIEFKQTNIFLIKNDIGIPKRPDAQFSPEQLLCSHKPIAIFKFNGLMHIEVTIDKQFVFFYDGILYKTFRKLIILFTHYFPIQVKKMDTRAVFNLTELMRACRELRNDFDSVLLYFC